MIEDEAKTAGFLKKGLGEAGFVVDVAEDGLDGLHLAQELQFDLVILDMMLPWLDGWQVLTRLRREGRRALVLFPTARDAVLSVYGDSIWARTTSSKTVRLFTIVRVTARV